MNKNNYCTLYIVRHGETDWSVRHIIQGHSNNQLNEKGKLQIKDLTGRLRNIEFDRIFSSDLLRARQTAEIINLERKLVIETTKALRERRFGQLEGKSGEKLVKTFDNLKDSLTKQERLKYRLADDVENDEEMISRIITFLRETSVAFLGKTILVVTHGGVMRVLLNHLGMDLPHSAIGNGAYIKLLCDGVDFYIKELEGISSQESEPIV